MKQDPLKLLKKLISFDTVADKNNLQLIKYLEKILKNQKFTTKKILADDKKSANLLAWRLGQSAKWLYFSGHTDTVPAGKIWTSNPWKLKSQGDKLYGLGSCDMKGGLAAILIAASETINPQINLGLIFTYDEETDFAGVKQLLKKQKLIPGPIIIAEPTNNQLVVANKGVLSFSAKFQGQSAHSSCPQNGRNAILLAMNFIKDCQSIIKQKTTTTNKYFEPNIATCNPGIIAGGDAVNKIPADCLLQMEFRTISSQQNTEIKKFLNLLAIKYQAKITYNLEIEPMQNTNKHLINKLEKISGQKASGQNYATEGNLFGQYGLAPIILGPGPMTAHQANEYVSQKSLTKSINIYKKIIANFDLFKLP
jgi:acetylornithine deacetylase